MKVVAWCAAALAVYFIFALFAVASLLGTVSDASAECSAPRADTPIVSGHYTQKQISQLWESQGGSTANTDISGVGPVANQVIAGAVGMAESRGDPNVVNSIGAGGLMQIHPPQPNYLDPAVNMRMAIIKWKDAKAAGGTGWEPWEAFTGSDARGDDGPWRTFLTVGSRSLAPPLVATDTSSCGGGGESASGTPKHIIDTIVLPLCNADGIPRTVAQNDMANAMHGPTVSGGQSDHQGPPDVAWAADMSNGVTTPEEDKLAADLAKLFNIPWSGAGLVSVTHGRYRYQLIYRTLEGGNHFNHIHLGVRVVG